MSDFVVDILENVLGHNRKHNDDSGQIAFDCPACALDKDLPEGDGKGNLEINYKKGIFRCWSCHDLNNMHGPIIKLLRRYGTDKSIRDYLLVKPEINYEKTDEGDIVEFIKLELPEGYKKLSECTSADYKYDSVMYYLKKRGITDDIIEKHSIGYTTTGKYFNRIIIPSYDCDGELNYFIARWFVKEKTKLKYLNPDTEKTNVIFNENKVNWDSTIYLVEGVFDHLVIPNSIPLLGKYINPNLLDKLHDKSGGYIVIVLDDDAYDDAKFLYGKLNFCDLMGRIRICKPPPGYDPSKIFETVGKAGIVALLKTSHILSEYE